MRNEYRRSAVRIRKIVLIVGFFEMRRALSNRLEQHRTRRSVGAMFADQQGLFPDKLFLVMDEGVELVQIKCGEIT